MKSQHLKGFGRLLRLNIRRDRIKVPITVMSFVVLVPALVAGVTEIFSSDAERKEGMLFLTANPVMRLFGLPSGDSFGDLMMLRAFMTLATIAALVSIFLVIRHTRQNEELGRSELVASLPVGRWSALAAALSWSIVVNLLIGAAVTLGLLTNDVFEMSGAIAMGGAVTVVGVAFTGIAAVLAQLTHSSRAANSLSSLTLMVAFLLASLASVLGEIDETGFAVEPMWVIWLSPIGWAQLMQPFAGEAWGYVALPALFTIVCVASALYLQAHRDVGRSLFSARLSRAHASTHLPSIAGIAWRLNRVTFASWLVGVSLLAAIYGAVAGDVEELLGAAEGFAEVFVAATGSSEILNAYFAATVGLIAIFILVFGAQLIVRMRQNEIGPLEYMLSTAVGRLHYFVTQIAMLLLAVVILIVVVGVVIAVVAHASLDDLARGLVHEIYVGALVQLPAIVLMLSLLSLSYAALPQMASGLIWLMVFVVVLLGPFFSGLFNFPDWVSNISPFSHTPAVPPLDGISVVPLVIMMSVALAFFVLSTWLFSRRDTLTTG